MIETERAMSFEELQREESFRALFPDSSRAVFRLHTANKKHVLTHRVLWANFYEIRLQNIPASLKKFIRIEENALEQYAVHRLMQTYLEDNKKIFHLFL
jgi:A/G-specific adenine glycosylase